MSAAKTAACAACMLIGHLVLITVLYGVGHLLWVAGGAALAVTGIHPVAAAVVGAAFLLAANLRELRRAG